MNEPLDGGHLLKQQCVVGAALIGGGGACARSPADLTFDFRHELLDSLGASATRIVLTGDLDEYSIAALGAVPVDGYGVGTSLVTGSGAPTAALVYKLVARARDTAPDSELIPVAKRSVGKPGRGGRKWAVRHVDGDGIAVSERISLTPPGPGPRDRELLVPLVAGGEIVGREPLAAARRKASGEAVAEAALMFLGTSYEWGGLTSEGIDCSGLVQAIHRRFGLLLPRNASQQEEAGHEVAVKNMQPGDLLCYGDHIAVALEGGEIVHSSKEAGGVVRFEGLAKVLARDTVSFRLR